MRNMILLLVTILILSACATPQDPLPGAIEQTELGAPALSRTTALPSPKAPATASPPAASLPDASPTLALDLPSLETPLANPDVETLVQKAREMLANKLAIEPGAIRLFDLNAMDWPDESLGCPLGGQNYAQVITPGYLIELEVDSAIYIFHSDQATRVVLCGIEPTREIFQGP